MGLDFEAGSERYQELGEVKTHVHYMTDTTNRIRDELYALEPDALAARARQYVRWAVIGQLPAWVAQLRRRSSDTSWLERIFFGVLLLASIPGATIFLIRATPKKLLAQRAVHVPASRASGDPVGTGIG